MLKILGKLYVQAKDIHMSIYYFYELPNIYIYKMGYVTHGIDIHCHVRNRQDLLLYDMKQGRHKITYCSILSLSVQSEINYKDEVMPSPITS